MTVRKLDQACLNGWVDSLIQKQRVFGVKADGERFAFGPLCCASELRLDYDVTKLPPKKYFLPQQEVLLKVDAEGSFESVTESEPFVLLGVHPYDVAAIAQLDAAFAQDNNDVHYQTRRNNATIVACDVQTASPNGFAGCMGTATAQEGFDVLLTHVAGGYVAEARTEKGEALMAGLAEASEPSGADLAEREDIWRKAPGLQKQHELKCHHEQLPHVLEKGQNLPLWKEKAEKCYSCGSCVLVCPTCFCFDVCDEADWDLKSGERVRRWDGCMLSSFALVAGGHNFRGDAAERFRHRYYRKGKYLWDRMGYVACVGCGRCVTACTTNIANPVEVYNELLEATQ